LGPGRRGPPAGPQPASVELSHGGSPDAASHRQTGHPALFHRGGPASRLARIHQKIVNQRGDFLHKVTTRLVNDHAGICIEDLNVKGLARTKLAKSFADAAMGEFRRQLESKCLWNRKPLVVVDRFFPSSKRCNRCGAINNSLRLPDRAWDCGYGAHQERDFLAACNVRDEGLRLLAVGQTESINAQGASVRPGTPGCWR